MGRYIKDLAWDIKMARNRMKAQEATIEALKAKKALARFFEGLDYTDYYVGHFTRTAEDYNAADFVREVENQDPLTSAQSKKLFALVLTVQSTYKAQLKAEEKTR